MMLQSTAGMNAALLTERPEPTFSERVFASINETRENLLSAAKHQGSLSDRLFGPVPSAVVGPDERASHSLEIQVLNGLSDLLDLSRQVNGNAGHLNSRI